MNFEKIFSNIFKFVDDVSVIDTLEKFEKKMKASEEAFNEIFSGEADCMACKFRETTENWECDVIIFRESKANSFTFTEKKPMWMWK